MIRGELAIGAQKSRHNLVFGRSVWIATMMQSCASSAKLRGGGPILHSGVRSHGFYVGAPPPRIHRQTPLARAAKPFALSLLFRHAVAHDAGRNTTPCGTSPLVTRRQRAMSSLRASATIIVLRVLARPSAVRAANHWVRALVFGT